MNAKIKSIVLVSILVLAGFVMVWNFGPENVNVKAASLYVGGVGPGNWSTIQEAIDNASAGDTIYVYDGIYNENIKINDSISLIGNGTDKSTIMGDNTTHVVNITADWVNITGLMIIYSGANEPSMDSGIYVDNVSWCKIQDCNVSNNLFGINFVDSDNCTIVNTDVFNSTHNGILMDNCQDFVLINNNVSYSNSGSNQWDYAGIHLNNSNSNVIDDNIVHNNTIYGIRLEYSHFNKVIINEIVHNCGGDAGIYFEYSHYNKIENNNITNNTGNGVSLYEADWNEFYNNTIDGNNLLASGYAGSLLYDSDNNTFYNNTLNYNIDDGFYVYYNSNDNQIIKNEVIGNTDRGIKCEQADRSIITGNNISDNDNMGLELNLADDSVVNLNDFYWNGHCGIYLDYANWNDVKNNNVSHNNKGSSPSSYAGLYSFHSHNNTYELNTVTDNPYYGFRIAEGDDELVLFNQIVNNCGGEAGIYMQNADSCEFKNNNVSNNTGNGFSMEDSDFNIFLNNTINGNNELLGADGGIATWDSYFNLWDNNSVQDNGNFGIYMWQSIGNLLTNCTITGSTVKDARSSSSDFTLLNCSFDKNKLAQSSSGIIRVEYYHTLFTYDWATVEEDAGGVAGATIWVNESGNPTHLFDRTSDTYGYTHWVNLTAYIYDGSYNYSMQDMQFHATKTGYSEGINVTNASAANFLIPIYMVDPYGSKIYDVTANPDENITKMNPTNVQAKIEEDNLLMAGMIIANKVGELGNNEMYDTVAFIFDNDPRVNLTPGPGNLTYFNGTFDGTNPGGWVDDGVNRTWAPMMFTPNPNLVGFNCWYTNESNPFGTSGFAMFNAGNGTFAGIHFENDQDLWPNDIGANDVIFYQTMRWIFDKQTGNLVNMVDNFVVAGFKPLDAQFEWNNKTPSGPYKALVFANDRSDNGGGNAVQITVDNMGPDNIILSVSPLIKTNITKGAIIVEATTTSQDTKNATFFWSEDSVNWIQLDFDDDGSDGWSTSKDTTIDPDMKGYIKVVMNDTWGNMNESKPFYLIIDNTPPDITITDPAQPDLVLGGDISLVAITTADDVEWCKFEYELASRAWSLLYLDDNGTNGWSYLMDSTAFADGNYTIRATMGDMANNTNVSLITLVVDNTAPNVTLVSPAPGLYFSTDFTVTVEIDELHMDRVEFWGSPDNLVWNLFYTDDDGSDGWTMEVNITGANEGHHWIEIIAYDTVGHNGTADWDAYVDTIAPEVSINSPSLGDYLAGTVMINASASDEMSGIDYAAINYDDGISTIEIYNSAPATDMFETSWDTTTHNDGRATLTLIAVDLAGLMSSTNITVTLDNTDPLADAGNDVTIDAGTALEFNGNGSSDNIGILSYEWNFTYDGAYQSLTGEKPTFKFEMVGDYEVTLTVRDLAGNSATNTMWVYVQAADPEVISTSPIHNSTDVAIDAIVTITFSMSMNITTVEPVLTISPTVVFTVTWNDDNTTLTMDFTADLARDTTYTITIGQDAKAITGGLLQDAPYSFKFTTIAGDRNTAPILTQGKITPTTGDTDTTFTFSVHYYDADGDAPDSIIVVIDGEEHEMTLTDGDAADGTYEYKAKLAEGSHDYYFTASDGTDRAVSDDHTPVNGTDASSTGEIEKAEETTTDWSLYIILIVVIIIVIAILAFAMTRRKPAEEELLAAEEEEEMEGEKEPFNPETYDCPTCGAQLKEDDNVCPECGEEFDDDEE